MGKKGRHSPKLTEEQQIELAEHALKHPEQTDKQIGLFFHVSPNQVRYARQKAERGDSPIVWDEIAPHLAAAADARNLDPVAVAREQISYALSLLRNDPGLPIGQRVFYIKQLIQAQGALNNLTLAGHLGEADMQMLYALIRMFRPDASDLECITILKEARQRCRIT